MLSELARCIKKMYYQGSLPRVLFVLHYQNNIPPKDVRIVGHLRNLCGIYHRRKTV